MRLPEPALQPDGLPRLIRGAPGRRPVRHEANLPAVLIAALAAASVIATVVLASLQFITLANLGGFAIRLPYTVLFAMLLMAVVLHPVRLGALRMAQVSALWLVPFMFYLLIAMPAFYGSSAQSSPVRQLFFALGTLGFAGCLISLRDPRPVLRLAGLLCLVTFLTVTEIVGRQVGVGWEMAISRFLAGDLDFVIYEFMRNIYNYFGDSSDAMVVASEKNAVAASLFLGLVLFRAAGPRMHTDWPGMVVTVVATFVLLMLNTRSTLLPLAGALALSSWLHLRRMPPPDIRPILLLLGGGAVLMAIMFSVLLNDGALVDMLESRFSLSDSSATSRLTQQATSIRLIEQAIFTGNGYIPVDDRRIHNLFLGAFVHAGVAAFLMTVVFYFAVLAIWLRFVLRLASGADFKVLNLRPEWVAALPLLPLVRVWLSGDAGHPELAEWLALGCFFALLAAERWPNRFGVKTVA